MSEGVSGQTWSSRAQPAQGPWRTATTEARVGARARPGPASSGHPGRRQAPFPGWSVVDSAAVGARAQSRVDTVLASLGWAPRSGLLGQVAVYISSFKKTLHSFQSGRTIVRHPQQCVKLQVLRTLPPLGAVCLYIIVICMGLLGGHDRVPRVCVWGRSAAGTYFSQFWRPGA